MPGQPGRRAAASPGTTQPLSREGGGRGRGTQTSARAQERVERVGEATRSRAAPFPAVDRKSRGLRRSPPRRRAARQAAGGTVSLTAPEHLARMASFADHLVVMSAATPWPSPRRGAKRCRGWHHGGRRTSLRRSDPMLAPSRFHTYSRPILDRSLTTPRASGPNVRCMKGAIA
jgi:hypothetical protein